MWFEPNAVARELAKQTAWWLAYAVSLAVMFAFGWLAHGK